MPLHISHNEYAFILLMAKLSYYWSDQLLSDEIKLIFNLYIKLLFPNELLNNFAINSITQILSVSTSFISIL